MRSHVGWHTERLERSALFPLRETLAGIVHFFFPAPGERNEAGVRITVLALIYTGGVGLFSLWSPRALNLEPMYLLGSVYAGWAAGRQTVLTVAIASGAFMFWSTARAGLEETTALVLCWNGTMQFLLAASAGWTAAWARDLRYNLKQSGRKLTRVLQEADKEQKETSAKLQGFIDLFRQATGNSSAVFWVIDPANNRLMHISSGYEKVWQRPRRAIYEDPENWLEGVHAKDLERVREAKRASRTGAPYDEEFRVVRPDGSICWVHDRTFPIRNEQGELYRIIGITEDITERKRALQLLETQRDVGIELSLTNDLKFGLARLLATVSKLDGIDCGGVYLANLETGALSLEAHFGLSVDFVAQNSRYRPGSVEARIMGCDSLQYVVCGPKPVYEEGIWRGGGIRGLAIVPLRHKGISFGALNLGSRRHDQIPSATRLVIETISAQTSDAIARLRLERELLEVSDREKARIGQDVHDGLCQQLVGAAFDANSLLQKLDRLNQAEAGIARRIFLLLQEAITESRRVAHGLYPVRLEKEGLMPALQELANRTMDRFGIECTCTGEVPDSHLDSNMATHLYRIAQEAVNNAVKHSGAKSISIVLGEKADAVEMKITDDGRGLKSSASRGTGMGMHIMEYRARTIGAMLSVTGDGAGTMVSCRLPAEAYRS